MQILLIFKPQRSTHTELYTVIHCCSVLSQYVIEECKWVQYWMCECEFTVTLNNIVELYNL